MARVWGTHTFERGLWPSASDLDVAFLDLSVLDSAGEVAAANMDSVALCRGRGATVGGRAGAGMKMLSGGFLRPASTGANARTGVVGGHVMGASASDWLPKVLLLP
jgi:hypothetical protein